MIKYLTTALILLTAALSHAQNTRTDTIMLSVYNTGSKFRVYPANFGNTTPKTGVIETLIALPDSFVVTPVPAGTRLADSTMLRKLKDLHSNRTAFSGTPIQSGRRTCGMTFPKDIKGKMVIVETDNACDDSEKCYLAQKAGATGILVIYPTENTNSVRMSGGRYNREITIPCYSITQKAGDSLRAQLPSKVAIFKPSVTTNTANSAVTQTTNQAFTTNQVKSDADATNDTELSDTKGYSKQGFSISPNPTRNQANVTYQFTNPTDVTIEAKTATGQVIFSRILRGATVGNVEIPTVDYPNGTYFVTLQYGKEVKTKKLVVRH